MQKASRTYLYESAADQIQAYIVEHNLQPGDRLPSQQELCDRLGISRSSLREALRLLQTAGILETRSGEGIFVTDFSLTPLVHQASRYLLNHPSHSGEVRELLEMRELLELQAVGLAADRLNENSLKAIRDILDQAEAKLEAGLRPIEESTRFHETIYRATQNGVLMRLASAVTRLVFELEKTSLHALDPTDTWVKRDYAEHLDVYEALRDRRKGDAVESMRVHLTHLRESVESRQEGSGAVRG